MAEVTHPTVQPAISQPQFHERFFLSGIALLFTGSAIGTLLWTMSMSTMSGMSMPGGWTMSMAWMRMPRQTWFDAATSFLGMWVIMMVAMMLPSLTPMLMRYRKAINIAPGIHHYRLTVVAGTGYFFIWILFGMAIFPVGVSLAQIAMTTPTLAQAFPIASGVLIFFAGALQFSRWKSQRLVCCRNSPNSALILPANLNTAWRYGLRIGRDCCYCCASPTLVLMVTGVMNPIAMMAVTAAITAERLSPAGERVAKVTGAFTVITGLFLIARATNIG
jgi:predicted metal-binding membrane protein